MSQNHSTTSFEVCKTAAAPRRAHLGHVHLEVTDLERSIDFYRDLVGLEVEEKVGDRFAFLSFGGHHHDVALQRIASPTSDVAAEPRPGLYHLAFELPVEEDLEALGDRLARAGVPFQVVDHGISHALYLQDPDGIGVEVYVDRRTRPDGRQRWSGRTAARNAS